MSDQSITQKPLRESLAEAENARVRAVADLQNFQRRQSEQQALWSAMAVSNFVEKFLPNFLELQLGADHSTDEAVKKVVEKFFDGLEKQGLVKIAPEAGDDIDPALHEVLMAEEGEAGKVVRVLEPGWQYGEKVVSPAKISGAIN